MDTKPIDYSVLSRPVTLQEIWKHSTYSIPGGSSLVGVGLAAVVFAPLVAVVNLHGKTALGYAAFWAIMGLGVFGLIAWLYMRGVKNSIRLERFAKANGWEFKPTATTDEQGTIFQLGGERHSDRVISGQYKGREFWFGTHYYTTGTGKNRHVHVTGVLNLALTRAVPHVVIDGRQNRLPLGGEFNRSQQLELEGDFNKYFTVYCPKDYERDALYFLTPELMQVLVDMNDKYDVEMLGQELYFYAPAEMGANEKQLRDIFNIIDTVGGEVSENTQRYQDWRVAKGLNQIAPPGMHLKRSIWPQIIALIVVIAYLIAAFVR